jgi:hypothetical protein
MGKGGDLLTYRGPQFHIRLKDGDDFWGELHWTSPSESFAPVPDVDVLHRLLNRSDPDKFVLFRRSPDSNGVLIAVSTISTVRPVQPSSPTPDTIDTLEGV